MAQPFLRRNAQAEQSSGARPLIDICVDALIRYSKFLGDIGWIETKHLRKICPHLTRSELESIEDLTLEGSGRDLSWYTWHCWFRMYTSLYGTPQPDELLPLEGVRPADYEPPKINCTAANYRGMILKREQAEEDRKAAAASRLRAGYNTENHKRLAHGVEYTTKLPPPKRAKSNSPGVVLQKQLAAYNASKTLGGKPAVKVMKDLGLGGKQGSSRSVINKSGSKQSSYNWRGKSAAAQQAVPPSALACLAKKKPGTAAVGQYSSRATPATAAGRPLGQAGQMQQHRSPRQHQTGLQKAYPSGSLGRVGARQPAGAAAAAAHLHPGGVGAKQRSSAAVPLDRPVSLGKAAAGGSRS